MSAARPWYKEPWPWLLMSGPAAVVLAGALTAWLAFAGADGLVAEDGRLFVLRQDADSGTWELFGVTGSPRHRSFAESR